MLSFVFCLRNPEGQSNSQAGLQRLRTHLRTQPARGRAGIQIQVFVCQAVRTWCVIVGTVDVLRETSVCWSVQPVYQMYRTERLRWRKKEMCLLARHGLGLWVPPPQVHHSFTCPFSLPVLSLVPFSWTTLTIIQNTVILKLTFSDPRTFSMANTPFLSFLCGQVQELFVPTSSTLVFS